MDRRPAIWECRHEEEGLNVNSTIEAGSRAPVTQQVLDAAAAHPVISADKLRSCELLGLGRGDRVLDVGCGPGYDLKNLVDVVGPDGVYGMDLKMSTLIEARRRLAADGIHIPLARASALCLPYASNSFDAVRAERLLQHVADPQKAVAEMVRVLRPGGRLHLVDTDWSTATVSCLPDALLAKLRRLLLEQWVMQPRVGSDLMRIVQAAGLDDAEVTASAVISRTPSIANLPAGELATLAPEDVAQIALLAEAAAAQGHLVGSVTMFSVTASKPSSAGSPSLAAR